MDATVRNKLIFKHFIVNLDICKMRKQGAACQNVIKHFWPAVMQHREAPISRQGPLHWGQDSRGQMPGPGVVLASASKCKRSVVVFCVEVPTNRDQSIGLGVDYALDCQPQLESLSGALHGRCEEALSPARDCLPGEWSRLLPGDGHRESRS